MTTAADVHTQSEPTQVVDEGDRVTLSDGRRGSVRGDGLESDVVGRPMTEAPAGADDEICPIAHTLQVLGSSKWTGYVVRELLPGPTRFKDVRAGVGGVNPKPLTDTLRLLEDLGLITRTAYPEMPPRVVYELTQRGLSLRPVLQSMADWGVEDLAAAR